MSQNSLEKPRIELSSRLRARRPEIDQAVLTRILAVSDLNESVDLDSLDPEYLEGLRAATSAAVDYGFAVLEYGEERAPPPPPVLLTQARLAARYGVGLDTVLRRYSAGFVLLTDFLVEEAERSGLRGPALRRLLRSQAALDRLLASVSEEYNREKSEHRSSSEQRRAERIERLLAGELLDTSELDYDFAGSHLGGIASGQGAWGALRDLSAALDRRLLAIRRGEGTVWAWFGGRHPVDMEELHHYACISWPVQATLAVGEVGEGLAGWRLTHNQARAALPIALRSSQPLVRYANVALLASILQDDLLATSLRQLYLTPLEVGRDGGKVFRQTLRAYFAADRNVSSAAAILGVSRRTVANRLRSIETRLGRPLSVAGAEMETALRFLELETAPRAANAALRGR
jgi:hypothetical protein